MTYITPTETASTSPHVPISGPILLRKTTESQGARSGVYEVKDATGKWLGRARTERARRSVLLTSKAPAEAPVAQLEHIGRLLRECRTKGEELLEAIDDPIRSALIGFSLTSLLQELWTYRKSRELDWIELVNVLQILLARQEFESLSREGRESLAAVFRDDLASPTVTHAHVSRALQKLSTAGFDIWRGVTDFSPE